MVETKFKHTDIGLIPEDWEVIDLKDNCTLKARIGWQGLTTSEYRESGDYYLITGTDFKNGFIDWDNCVFVDKSRYDQDKNIQVQANDVLITKDGTIGKVAYIDRISKPTTLNSGVFVLRTVNDKLNSKFVYYILMSFYFDDFLKQITAGSTITHLYQKDFIHFEFVLPPLPEQQAIAEVLSDTDTWIESLEKLIAKKQLIKQGAMQQLLTPKEDWEVKKLGEVAQYRRGSFPQPYGLDKWYDDTNGMPFIQVFDVAKNRKLKNDTKRKISAYAQPMSVFVSKNTIVLTIQGSIGRIALTQYDAYCDRTLLIFESLNENLDKFFFLLMVEQIFEIEKQSAPGGTIKTITKEALSDFYIAYPKSKNEQIRIANILSDMDIEIEALEQKLAKARQIKQGLMQELLTGKIRLVQPNDKKEAKPAKGHNDHFNDAVLIGTMASCFASEQFPLTRFKYTKVSYLLKRYKEEQTTGYLKKAAGPYKPETRYGGAEKIAINRKYIAVKKSTFKGKQYEGFLQSENIDEALNYFKSWYGEDSLEWVKQFKFETNDNLELWATVDMAIQDLKQEEKVISLETVKQFIKENKEWRDKLKRPAFSDKNIESAIGKVGTLYT